MKKTFLLSIPLFSVFLKNYGENMKNIKVSVLKISVLFLIALLLLSPIFVFIQNKNLVSATSESSSFLLFEDFNDPDTFDTNWQMEMGNTTGVWAYHAANTSWEVADSMLHMHLDAHDNVGLTLNSKHFINGGLVTVIYKMSAFDYAGRTMWQQGVHFSIGLANYAICKGPDESGYTGPPDTPTNETSPFNYTDATYNEFTLEMPTNWQNATNSVIFPLCAADNGPNSYNEPDYPIFINPYRMDTGEWNIATMWYENTFNGGFQNRSAFFFNNALITEYADEKIYYIKGQARMPIAPTYFNSPTAKYGYSYDVGNGFMCQPLVGSNFHVAAGNLKLHVRVNGFPDRAENNYDAKPFAIDVWIDKIIIRGRDGLAYGPDVSWGDYFYNDNSLDTLLTWQIQNTTGNLLLDKMDKIRFQFSWGQTGTAWLRTLNYWFVGDIKIKFATSTGVPYGVFRCEIVLPTQTISLRTMNEHEVVITQTGVGTWYFNTTELYWDGKYRTISFSRVGGGSDLWRLDVYFGNQFLKSLQLPSASNRRDRYYLNVSVSKTVLSTGPISVYLKQVEYWCGQGYYTRDIGFSPVRDMQVDLSPLTGIIDYDEGYVSLNGYSFCGIRTTAFWLYWLKSHVYLNTSTITFHAIFFLHSEIPVATNYYVNIYFWLLGNSYSENINVPSSARGIYYLTWTSKASLRGFYDLECWIRVRFSTQSFMSGSLIAFGYDLPATSTVLHNTETRFAISSSGTPITSGITATYRLTKTALWASLPLTLVSNYWKIDLPTNLTFDFQFTKEGYYEITKNSVTIPQTTPYNIAVSMVKIIYGGGGLGARLRSSLMIFSAKITYGTWDGYVDLDNLIYCAPDENKTASISITMHYDADCPIIEIDAENVSELGLNLNELYSHYCAENFDTKISGSLFCGFRYNLNDSLTLEITNIMKPDTIWKMKPNETESTEFKGWTYDNSVMELSLSAGDPTLGFQYSTMSINYGPLIQILVIVAILGTAIGVLKKMGKI